MNHPCLNSIIYGNMYNYYIIGYYIDAHLYKR